MRSMLIALFGILRAKSRARCPIIIFYQYTWGKMCASEQSKNYVIACSTLKEEFNEKPVPPSPDIPKGTVLNNSISLFEILISTILCLMVCDLSCGGRIWYQYLHHREGMGSIFGRASCRNECKSSHLVVQEKDVYPILSKVYRKYNSAVVSSIPS